MALFDATASANRGTGTYEPASPFVIRVNQVDFSVYSFTSTGGANLVNVMPLYKGEWIQSCVFRTDAAGNASSTVSLTDTRTGALSSGAVLAATAASTGANTYTLAAGGAVGVASGTQTTTDGFLQMTNVAAFALNTGKATVACFLGKSF
jgi:hypothetical protein